MTVVPHISAMDEDAVRPYGKGEITIPAECIDSIKLITAEDIE